MLAAKQIQAHLPRRQTQVALDGLAPLTPLATLTRPTELEPPNGPGLGVWGGRCACAARLNLSGRIQSPLISLVLV